MNLLEGLLLTAALLLLSAFFVGAEFALIGARRSKIESDARAGKKLHRVALYALEHVSLMMAGAQLGITICAVALGVVSEPVIAHALEGPLEAIGVPSVLLHPIALIIALAAITYLHVVMGEMVPKNIAIAGPERTTLALALPFVLFVWLLYPLLWLLNAVANGVLRLVGVTPQNEVTSTFTPEEVAELVVQSRTAGLLDEEEEQLIRSALAFPERKVENVLLPVDQIKTLPARVTYAELEEAARGGFSRFPVESEHGGSFLGYLHVKDTLTIDKHKMDAPLDPATIRPLPEAAHDDDLRSVLTAMQSTHSHLAIIRDQQGQVCGMVTLEDILGELVGQIRDRPAPVVEPGA